MPVSQRAGGWVSGQVGRQPLRLRRFRAGIDLAIQRDDVPRAKLKAVVTAPFRTGAFAKIIVVARRAGCGVIVIAGRWPGACLVAAPGWIVAIAELFG